MRTIAGLLPHTVVVGEHGGSRTRRQLAGAPGIGNATREMACPHLHGVVPIVYKAQRALLDSLIQSTLWSFLTITPLMMIVSRSIAAGAVAMIPNVLPVLVIFGAMGWMGISIDIGSMMSASIALGGPWMIRFTFCPGIENSLTASVIVAVRSSVVTPSAQTPTLQAALNPVAGIVGLRAQQLYADTAVWAG